MARRQEDSSRVSGRNSNNRTYRSDTYVEGNAVRYLEDVSGDSGRQKMQLTNRPKSTRRARGLQLTSRYVAFLFVAVAVFACLCAQYVSLLADGKTLQKRVTSLSAQVEAAKLENDAEYYRIMTGLDMSQLREDAIERLGMGYPKKSQIVEYHMDDSDYVRQYVELPEE